MEKQLLPLHHLNARLFSSHPGSCLLLLAKPAAATLPATRGSSKGLAAAFPVRYILPVPLLGAFVSALPRFSPCAGRVVAASMEAVGELATTPLAAMGGYCSARTPAETIAPTSATGAGKQHDALRSDAPTDLMPLMPQQTCCTLESQHGQCHLTSEITDS